MKIGELAQAAGATVETIRYYEKQGLLEAPVRNSSNYRVYGATQLNRLRLIRNCRALDMTHKEIRALLQGSEHSQVGCAPINQIFDAHIIHVDKRIAELIQLKAQLLKLRRQCSSIQAPATACGILHGLSNMSPIAAV